MMVGISLLIYFLYDNKIISYLPFPKCCEPLHKREGFNHYTKGMFFDIFESLKVALGLFCMAQKLFCFFTMQCWYCFDCCCHNLISYHYVNCQPVTKLTG